MDEDVQVTDRKAEIHQLLVEEDILAMKLMYRETDQRLACYVVLHKGNYVTPWVTHKLYTSDGHAFYESGNYFSEEEAAWKDFKERT